MRLRLLFLVYLLDCESGYCMTVGTAELVGTSGNTFGVFGSILAEMFVQMLVACDFHQYVLLGHNFF